MGKRKTISQRWYAWMDIPSETTWAILALVSFSLSMIGLVAHLGGGWLMKFLGLPDLVGIVRTVGLFMLIGFDVLLLGITCFRRQMVWFWFFVYITIGVIGAELISYFLLK